MHPACWPAFGPSLKLTHAAHREEAWMNPLLTKIYVLDDEEGINALAVGHAPGDAAIGVTRGCMTLLNRDELQGVIGHKFSHILNGDMRLNLRLQEREAELLRTISDALDCPIPPFVEVPRPAVPVSQPALLAQEGRR